MAIAECGYVHGSAIFSPAEIQQLQTSLTETTNRLARGFLTPYATSLPDLPLEDRLERVAQQDRAYAYALLHGIFADAQQDPRIAGLATHPRLLDHVQRLVAPRAIIGQIIRVRVNDPGVSAETQSVASRRDRPDRAGWPVQSGRPRLLDAPGRCHSGERHTGSDSWRLRGPVSPPADRGWAGLHCAGAAPRHATADAPLPCGRCALFGSVFAASHAPQSDDTDTMDFGHVGEMPALSGARHQAHPWVGKGRARPMSTGCVAATGNQGISLLGCGVTLGTVVHKLVCCLVCFACCTEWREEDIGHDADGLGRLP